MQNISMKTHINSNQPQNFLFKPVKPIQLQRNSMQSQTIYSAPIGFNWTLISSLKVLIRSILKSPMHNISLLVEFGNI